MRSVLVLVPLLSEENSTCPQFEQRRPWFLHLCNSDIISSATIISEDAVIIVAGIVVDIVVYTSVDNVVVLQYTWAGSRLWRKNRRKGTLCDGVDLNRNYNSMWGGVSHSAASTCSVMTSAPK